MEKVLENFLLLLIKTNYYYWNIENN